MEGILTKVRERSGTPNNQYRFQVKCEAQIAMAYLVLGDDDKAIETLERPNQLKGPLHLNRDLDLWFIFDRLRGNPRFDALLKD